MKNWTVGWKVRGELKVVLVDVDQMTSGEAITKVKRDLKPELDQIVAFILERP